MALGTTRSIFQGQDFQGHGSNRAVLGAGGNPAPRPPALPTCPLHLLASSAGSHLRCVCRKTIFCNPSATPEPLASSHNLGCHFP